MPRYDAIEVRTLHDDFSRGVVGRISPVGLKKGVPPNFLKSADNELWRPSRAGSVRPGSRDASQAQLLEPPHSLGKHYHASGNKLYAAVDSGGGNGHLYRMSQTTRTLQVLPYTPTSRWMDFAMANGLIVGCQLGGLQPPIFYGPTNTADTWLSLVIPKPTVAPTFNANSAGGALTVTKDYFYRHRYRFGNGSTLSGPVSAARQVVAASGNYTINLVIPVYAGARTDYVGWILERTKANGSAAGPWYIVKPDGTASTYTDGASDASLFGEADETIHGEPVVMDGTIFHRGRLVGWRGSNLYLSQPVVGDESTGICNWIGDLIYPVGKDDGDEIQDVVRQGERLVIGKRTSVWTFDGDDVDSFRLLVRYEGAGFAGPRAAVSLGGTIFFAAGDGRLFVMRGVSVDPIGADEVGDYLLKMDTGRDAEIVAVNYLGDFILFWYVPQGHSVPDEFLAYDLRHGNWSHHTEWCAVDALVQKDRVDFNGATLLLADPRQFPAANSGAVALNPSFTAFTDFHAGTFYQAFVQKLSAAGALLWGGGVQVSQTATNSFQPSPFVLSTDDDGGCFVVVLDYQGSGTSPSTLIANRLDANGVRQWNAGALGLNGFGTVLNALTTAKADHQAVSDGDGGIIACWTDLRAGTTQIYIQRINKFGAAVWTANGIRAFSATSSEATPSIVADGAGGCYVSADVTIVGLTSRRVIRIDSLGAVVAGFPVDALPAVTSYAPNRGNRVMADGLGSMLVAGDQGGTLRAQSISSGGAKQWNGGTSTLIASGAADSAFCPDGYGGMYALWRVDSGSNHTLYLQRVLSSGLAKFASPMTIFSDTDANVGQPSLSRGIPINCALVPDGSGGVTILWSLQRHISAGITNNALVCARHVSAAGSLEWTSPYALVANTADDDFFIGACTDGSGGALVSIVVPTKGLSVARVNTDGSVRWLTATQGTVGLTLGWAHVVFTNTPDSEYPAAALAGFHVWSAMRGTTDFADFNGDNGIKVPIRLKSHFYDDGLPEYEKTYERIEVIVNRGKGTIVVTIETDTGEIATLTLTATSGAPKYNSGVKYNSGEKYGKSGASHAFSGIERGVSGNAAAVTISGNLEDMEIGGFILDSYALPKKEK